MRTEELEILENSYNKQMKQMKIKISYLEASNLETGEPKTIKYMKIALVDPTR